ncbi:hypothetical protein GA0115233_10675 [Streptomyces sp. DI166]|nr:hypothetical protein GA0115233_10675 [Streptomyces sp. DI166]
MNVLMASPIRLPGVFGVLEHTMARALRERSTRSSRRLSVWRNWS